MGSAPPNLPPLAPATLRRPAVHPIVVSTARLGLSLRLAAQTPHHVGRTESAWCILLHPLLVLSGTFYHFSPFSCMSSSHLTSLISHRILVLGVRWPLRSFWCLY